MRITLSPKPLGGRVEAVSSKSQLQRLILGAMLCDSPTEIRYRGLSEDVEAFLRCASALGATVEREEMSLRILPGPPPKEPPILQCGMSGAAARFFLPLGAALCDGFTLTGEGSLLQRPMESLCQAISVQGCRCSGSYLPIQVSGRLRGGSFKVRGDESSQYLSGLLMTVPLLFQDSRIEVMGTLVSRPYVDLTLGELRRFGIRFAETEAGFVVPGRQRFISPGRVTAQGDWSAAAFWLCAGELSGRELAVDGLDLHSPQGDKAILEYIRALRGAGEREVDIAHTPDLFPALAVLAAGREGVTCFRNTARLRLKESDRARSVQALLEGLGATVRREENRFWVQGGELRGGCADSFGDHRIAMAAAIASQLCREPVSISGAECVSKSYPDFWRDISALGAALQQD